MGERIALWGWLDQGDEDPLSGKEKAQRLLCTLLGLPELPDTPPSLFDPASLPKSSLTASAKRALLARFGTDGFSEDPVARAKLSLGQSYADQIRRRSGLIDHAVDAVVRPASIEDASALLAMADEFSFAVLAAGGATNVVGAFDNHLEKRPRVVADMTRMNQVIEISEQDHTIIVEAGIRLTDLEAALETRGLTLGHFPQSFHGATLGGSIACNGAGQRSDGYGRLSDALISATLATPAGIWATERFRHASTGPWLGGLVAGSEGQFGLICSVKLAVNARPELVEDRAWFLPDFETACDAARRLAQNGHGLAMLRISDANETEFLSAFRLAMAGRHQPPLLERLALAVKRIPRKPVLLIAGYEGKRDGSQRAFADVEPELKRAGGVALGQRPGASWRKGRYALPYLRESLMRRGLGVDTFETAMSWSAIHDMHAGVLDTIKKIVATTRGDDAGHAAVMCHLSHSYREGACLYFTAIFPRNDDALGQWRIIKSQATDTIVQNGGTVSHHHGMGADHADYAYAEMGEVNVFLLKSLKRTLDPKNLLLSGAQSHLS